MAVADRLRAEAEEELTALRTAHQDMERELAAAQQRQKEADVKLVTLREELKECREKLATLTRPSSSDPERPNEGQTYSSESKESPQSGIRRGMHKMGQERMEGRSQSEVGRNVASEDCKGIAKRYLRNVNSEERSREDARASETRRPFTTERSR